MEPNADKLRGLRITSLDDEDDDETELPNQPLPASTMDVAAAASGYDDDDEDEDEDEEAEVMLGFLEKPKHPGLLLRHLFPSKAGGIPAWLDPVNLPSGNSRCCGFCGEPLHFVLQIYAPIESNAAAFHRTLFMFMCPSMACLHRDQHEQWTRNQGNPRRSVRVFRCQLPRTNAFYSSEPPSHNNSDKPLCAGEKLRTVNVLTAETKFDGAALCHWCGTWKGDKICGSCKKSRYCSEKHQALHWRSGHKIDCLQIINSSEASSSVLPAVGKVPARSSWPEYQIAIDDEVDLDSDSCDENSSKSLVIQKHGKPDDTMQSWMDQFEADADNRCWAYFQERITRGPKQVLRYCRDPNAKPLWALSAGRPSNADIPKCSYCKGPLCYEFQIMPQLLYYFGVRNEPDSLDWATVVVYTCQGSCDESISYMEEFAWVQLYPTSITRP
ncbi:programmed cell death protein 2 isoform X1 [Hordeum vulgare subsp. vulgare]|uniref:programmed cell death protein 2 isoform X1 n=1 Tax=Hordeum vulgare subsp. vulgare TaxID=112509 RepID=UPI0002969122|nr:programmed cell death protein 2 isoform X1 [Hordeum vulgare subsp. vulgare]XP_044981826.1 programmed cell death protein 2 isoform X1 [Hordeum vulgare subsp. vulgare]